MPGVAGLETPGVLFAQSFNGVTYFGRALSMKGALAALADN